VNEERGGLWKEAFVSILRYYPDTFPKGLRETSYDLPGQPVIGHKCKQEFPEYRSMTSLLSQYLMLCFMFDDSFVNNKLSSILFLLLMSPVDT